MLKRHTQTPLYQGNTKMLPLGTSPAHRLDWEVYVKSLIVDPSTPLAILESKENLSITTSWAGTRQARSRRHTTSSDEAT